ncbi:unnamed protein product, partial [Allacma fusca]
EFHWDTSHPDYLTGEIIATNVAGYAGIGFSRSGDMPGSDIILMWIDDQGRVYLKDFHATKNAAPIKDVQQDVELLTAERNDVGFRVIFRWKWDTCDDDEDFQIGHDTVKLIWAWSNDVFKGNGAFQWHGNVNRGVRSVSLKFEVPSSSRVPHEGGKYWDAIHPNFVVP